MVSHGTRSVATICAALSARGAASDAFGHEPCDRQTSERWKKDSFKFPLYQYLWQNGLTNSETWLCPDVDARERLLGFRPDHSRPAMSTSAKTWELEHARLRLFGAAVPTGVLAILFSVLFHNLQVPAAHQPVLTLCQSCFTESRWDQGKPGNRHHQRDISTTEAYRSRSAAFGSSGAPWRRCRAARSVHRGGNAEKFMALQGKHPRRAYQRVGTSSSYQWGSSGVYGPHQTFIPKGSMQWIQW